MSKALKLPPSVTSLPINTAALALSLAALAVLVRFGEGPSMTVTVLVLWASYVLPVMLMEALWLRRERPPVNAAPDLKRASLKILGLITTLLLIAGVYWLLPEYRGAYYDRYYAVLGTLLPWYCAVALPYMLWADARHGGEHDGYWHVGQLVIGNWSAVDRRTIGQHLLGWLVKLFFLPLMFIFFVDKVAWYRSFDYATIFNSFQTFYTFAYNTLFYIDLLVAFVGYTCTFRATDSHIRSTEPTLLGWLVAIMCYPPFWPFFLTQYLNYENGSPWGVWLWDHPLAYALWGSMILILIGIYSWASLAFGIRFSNLTHRGILTNGPYRFTKHPAYVSKNLSWWMISMPFMVHSTPTEAVRLSLLLLLVNVIYFIRARTEERHLSADPVYCSYAAYIEAHGLFRRTGAWLPVLRFRPGHLFNLSGEVSERPSGG